MVRKTRSRLGEEGDFGQRPKKRFTLKDSTESFRTRSFTFAEYLEKNLKASPRLDVSSFVFTEDELKHSHPFLLDVRGHTVLHDRGFFKEILKSTDEFCEGGAAKELKAGS